MDTMRSPLRFRLAAMLRHAVGRWLGLPCPEERATLAADMTHRLREASDVWTGHLRVVQAELQEAIQHVLSSFHAILAELDGIVATPAADASDRHAAARLDVRAEMLERCERNLRGLTHGFQQFLESGSRILGSVRSLSEASQRLEGMAEDVRKIARQTNLLSINAAIEAARAGDSGRGFAVVASEVRRLSGESGTTGARITEQLQQFGEQIRGALAQADEQIARDTRAIEASERTVSAVIGDVDSTVSQLNARAAELRARGEAVKAQIEQLLVALQFQDRVAQILGQLERSIAQALHEVPAALAAGKAPPAADWSAVLNGGYTTAEQRAVMRGSRAGTPAPAALATTFF